MSSDSILALESYNLKSACFHMCFVYLNILENLNILYR